MTVAEPLPDLATPRPTRFHPADPVVVLVLAAVAVRPLLWPERRVPLPGDPVT